MILLHVTLQAECSQVYFLSNSQGSGKQDAYFRIRIPREMIGMSTASLHAGTLVAFIQRAFKDNFPHHTGELTVSAYDTLRGRGKALFSVVINNSNDWMIIGETTRSGIYVPFEGVVPLETFLRLNYVPVYWWMSRIHNDLFIGVVMSVCTNKSL